MRNNIIMLKGCQRCGGDAMRGSDWHGDFIQCIQCGWYKDEPGDPMTAIVDASMANLFEEMRHRKAS